MSLRNAARGGRSLGRWENIAWKTSRRPAWSRATRRTRATSARAFASSDRPVKPTRRARAARNQLRLAVLDPAGAVLQPHDQIVHVARRRDRLGEAVLFGAHAGELGIGEMVASPWTSSRRTATKYGAAGGTWGGGSN